MARDINLKGNDRKIIISVQQDILKNPALRFTIDSIASKVGINTTKLKYGFKKLFGLGIHEYQLKLRMEKAESLLIETDKDIKRIALLTGYRNNSSFNVAFKKKHAGVAPLQWRKNNSIIKVK